MSEPLDRLAVAAHLLEAVHRKLTTRQWLAMEGRWEGLMLREIGEALDTSASSVNGTLLGARNTARNVVEAYLQ